MAIEKSLYDMPEGIEDMGEADAIIAIDGMSDEKKTKTLMLPHLMQT